MAKRFWTARLIVNLILVAALETIGIFFVYYMGYLPLKAHGHEEWNYIIHHFNIESPIWWRVFLKFAFDNLLLFIAAIGLYWGLGTFAVYAREEAKWRKYYSSPEAKREPWIEKFTLWQRIQHVWVFSTFIVCAYTGIVMYMGNNPYWHFLYFASREDFVRAHVIAGWLMGAIMIFHFAYDGTMILLDMIKSDPIYGEPIMEKYPMLQFWRKFVLHFLKQLVQYLVWFITPKFGKPEADKYDPEQLFEYWGVYWGTLVLAIPGAFMAVYGPQVLYGVFWITHVKEAMLAITYLLMVHMAAGHFKPTDFPMNPTYLHGKMPLERIKEEHPLWYKRLVRKGIVKEGARP